MINDLDRLYEQRYAEFEAREKQQKNTEQPDREAAKLARSGLFEKRMSKKKTSGKHRDKHTQLVRLAKNAVRQYYYAALRDGGEQRGNTGNDIVVYAKEYLKTHANEKLAWAIARYLDLTK